MPLYAYVCDCGHRAEEYRTVKSRKRGPKHCGKTMKIEITGTHQLIGVFQPYRAIGRGRPWISTRKEHRDYLRQNGYEEVGNDSSMAPPDMGATEAEWNQQQEPIRREIRQSFEDLAAFERELARS